MKRLIIPAVILLIGVATCATVYFSWRSYFFKKKLPELVYLQSDSLYRISYGNVFIDEVAGEIRISNLLLRPDTTHTSSGEKFPQLLLELFIPVLHLTGLRTERAMLNEEVIARRLQLNHPVVTLYRNTGPDASPEAAPLTTHELYKVILRNLVRIQIDSIHISNASYNMVGWQTGDTLLTASPVNIALHDLHISDSTSKDTGRVMFAKRATLSVDDVRIYNTKGKYVYVIKDIDLDSRDRSLSAASVRLMPLLTETDFMRVSKWQTDRFDVWFHQPGFTNVRVQDVLDGNLVADDLAISQCTLKIFRDKSRPFKRVSKVGKYPHQQLTKLPFDLSLKKVTVSNSYIEYKEKNPGTGKNGLIRFHHVDIALHNISNKATEPDAGNVCRVIFKGKFLNAVPISARLQLYPFSRNGKFTVQGTLGTTDATVFNQLARPLGLASIESGKLQQLQFRIRGNDLRARGTVTMLYRALKVQLLKQDPEEAQYRKREVASIMANATILDQNPGKNKIVRVAQVDYERDIYRSFFNLLWKSIFSGVKETVGIEE